MDDKKDLPDKLSAAEQPSPAPGAVDGSKYKMARAGNWIFEFNQPAGVVARNGKYPIEYHFTAHSNGYVTVVDRFNKENTKVVVINSQGIVPLIPELVDKESVKRMQRFTELKEKAKVTTLTWVEQNEMLKIAGFVK